MSSLQVEVEVEIEVEFEFEFEFEFELEFKFEFDLSFSLILSLCVFEGNVESCRQLKSVDWALLNRRHLKPPKTSTAKP